jgi:radical SAM superfamily enzyme YgiQ (UPF0313 family)
MHGRSRRVPPAPVPRELGVIRKAWPGRLAVALAYPNRYRVGMSNLGFQTVYGLFNARQDVVCERMFLPEPQDPPQSPPLSVESRRPARDFHLLAFSLAFENDYPHLLTFLKRAGLPLRAANRDERHPLVAAGGVAATLNPEPLAPFVDVFLVGEAEALLPGFLDRFDPDAGRAAHLEYLAREVPGVYVPSAYAAAYGPDGLLAAMAPTADVPPRVRRVWLADLGSVATASPLVTPDTIFADTCLVEVSRGCPHGCRFCAAGFVYRPPRFRTAAHLAPVLEAAAARAPQVGLVGAAVSDLPDLGPLCHRFQGGRLRLSFSSLRADNLSDDLLAVLREQRTRTATIAPEAGSARMRRVINKGLEESAVLEAARRLVSAGVPNLKLYFLVGLPTETEVDVDAILDLCVRIKAAFLEASRPRKRMGTITVSVNPFIPKPVTPFQWSAMAAPQVLASRLGRLQEGLRRVANVHFQAEALHEAQAQALMARGDRRVADLLERHHTAGSTWRRSLRGESLELARQALRERPREECLPWEVIDHGVSRGYLWQEYRRAREARVTPPCPPEGCQRCGACPPPAPGNR